MRHGVCAVVLLALACLPPLARTAQATEILRDPWGVPHVFAESAEDGFFGLGYATAEDRRLQMELVRRKGAGRLAEVFGTDWVASDRESRIASYTAWSREALAKLPAEMQSWLGSYAAGVNAWTSANPETVARRFQPLGVAPEPWTPADCLLAARAVLSLGSPFNDQAITQYHRFQELAAQVGEAAAGKQFYMAVEDAAAIVSEAEMAKDAEPYQRLKDRPRMSGYLLQGTPAEGPKMSHAWAVGGARSKTGKPLLESDPQLPLNTPPFFYEFHLVAGPIDARGLGVPGCPGLFIGFNRHIAWGGSALGTGSQVVFLEKLTDNGQHYLFGGKAEPFTRRLERIRVKDGPDVVQEVLGTRHGVVFNSLSQTNRPGEAHVLYDPQTMQCGTTVRAMLAFMTASNWTEFRAAMEHYYDPGLHIVYADDQNNVGYHTLVHRPLTVRTPRMAQEGWTGQQEITGRIPSDEMPHLFNPDQGFISHANNMPIGTWYPHDLGLGTGGNGHTGRSWRLQQLLTGTHKYGVEDFEALVHRDPLNPLLLALLPIAIKVADEDQVEDAAVKRLIGAVRGWDLRAETLAKFPALAALRNVLTPYRGCGLNDVYGAGMGGVTNLARRLAADFAGGGATPRGERERAYLIKWLQASAQGTLGRGRGAGAADDWTARLQLGAPEGVEQTITIPYQGMTPLPMPKIDPSLDIVSPPLTCLDTGTIWSQPGNFYTQIVDLADLDNSRAMIAPGNCEDGKSPLRTAGIDLWVQGRTRPAPLSRDKVEQLGCSTTRVKAQPYEGPLAATTMTVDQPDSAAQFVAAIPAVELKKEVVESRPRPAEAQKPDDPQLEAAFRVILRASGTPNEEVDAQLAETRKYVEGKPDLIKQLRGGAVLGIYLIEESAAGRLKVQYGSPYVLQQLRALLKELDGGQQPAPAPASEPDSKPSPSMATEPGLLGYWPLRGDCQDHSGNGLHAVNHGVKLDDGTFDGRQAYLEIPPSRKLQLSAKDFSFSVWVHTDKDVDDVIGDVVSQYDAATRRGVNLTLKSTAGGYSSHGDDRHVYFGIDNAQEPTWEDCGRPSATSNYVSNSLTVFDGHLYAATTDAEKFEDWCHVFRYAGAQKWEDCGRVGDRRTHGVGPMVVHDGSLYVGTWTYDWTRVGIQQPLDDFCCVYRYAGGTTWEDCGQPGQCRRLFGLASYRGKLYVSAEDGRCYVYAGERQWKECGKFPNYAHPLGIHDGKLYAGVLNPAGVWAFDGQEWSLIGNPQGREERCNQIHALEVYRGQLHATTWPEGHVCRLEANGGWTDLGRLGDALEINALSVYNGQLYGGTIPRAEVFRCNPTVEPGKPVPAAAPEPKPTRRVRRPAPPPEPGSAAWPSVRRFLDPAGYEFKDSNEWARVTSLTTYQGKQFASLGSCTSSRLDAPCDFRGQVYAMEAGRCVSYDRNLGPGWHHLAAVRRGDRLELFVDGQLVATSSTFDPAVYDLTTRSPLRIGFGEVDYFSGKIREVRLYGRALEVQEIKRLAAESAGSSAAPQAAPVSVGR
jgi:penicillin amidase